MRINLTYKITDWIKVIGSALASRIWSEMGAYWQDYSAFDWEDWE